MKKIICFFMSLLLTFTLCLVPISASSATEEFNNLQEDITESLTIANHHYIYDKDLVSNMIDNFDVNALNMEVGTSYTIESLKNAIFSNLDNYYVSDPKPQTRGTYCNADFDTSGWNYYRYFTNHDHTALWSSELDKNANSEDDIALILLPFGFNPMITVTAGIMSINSKWRTSFAGELRSHNGRCGVVSDINKFTSAYTVTNQLNWAQ